MWRRYADIPYTLLVLGVFTLELLGMGALIWTFSLQVGQLVPSSALVQTLLATIVVTSLGLLFLTAYILAYHVLSVPRERRRQQRLEAWTEHWFNILFANAPMPSGVTGREAQEAALEIRERLSGEEGRDFSRLLDELQVGKRLVARLSSRRLTHRLDALDALAKARLPSVLPSLIAFVLDREPVVRFLSARAVARTMAELEPGPQRQYLSVVFARTLQQAMPYAELRALEGQDHNVSPAALAPVLLEFLT